MAVSYEPTEVARGAHNYVVPITALALTVTAAVPAGSMLVVWAYTTGQSPSPTNFFCSDNRNNTFYGCPVFTHTDAGGSVPVVGSCAMFTYVVQSPLQVGDIISVGTGGAGCGAVAAYFSYVRNVQAGSHPGVGAVFGWTKSPNDNVYDLNDLYGLGAPHNDLTDLTQGNFTYSFGTAARALLLGVVGAEVYGGGTPSINLTGTEESLAALDLALFPGPPTTTYIVKGRMQPFYRIIPGANSGAIFTVPASSPGVENWSGGGFSLKIWADWTLWVTDPCTNLPVWGVYVTLTGPGPTLYTGYTGSDGSVLFPGLALGAYAYTIGSTFDTPGHTPGGTIGTTTGTFTLLDGEEKTTLADLSRPSGCPSGVGLAVSCDETGGQGLASDPSSSGVGLASDTSTSGVG